MRILAVEATGFAGFQEATVGRHRHQINSDRLGCGLCTAPFQSTGFGIPDYQVPSGSPLKSNLTWPVYSIQVLIGINLRTDFHQRNSFRAEASRATSKYLEHDNGILIIGAIASAMFNQMYA